MGGWYNSSFWNSLFYKVRASLRSFILKKSLVIDEEKELSVKRKDLLLGAK